MYVLGTAGGWPSSISRRYSSTIRITFSEALDRSQAEDADNYNLQEWNYRWTQSYGSPHFKVSDPKKQGHDDVEVESASLSPDTKTVTLKVAPLKFGTNTFLATVKDKNGKPVEGASVLLQTTMLDMEMGAQSLQLHPVGADSPGTYAGQADLDMGGDWAFAIKVLPAGGKDFETAAFKVVVGYS